MAIPADTGAGNGAPFAKFRDCGDVLVGAFASDPSKSRRQVRNFDTQAPEVKPDGSPRLEEVLHLVAMPGTTAITGDLTAPNSIEEGAHVRFAVSGYKWGQLIDARKQLPAHAGFAAGTPCSGDVLTITLVGWSAETKNAAAATAAGFTVADDRIILRSQDDKDRYVLAQSRNGGNTNPAKDYEITLRRPTAEEKRWEQAADELYLTKPWETAAVVDERTPALAGHSGGYIEEEPF
jgi:hypothetical protein